MNIRGFKRRTGILTLFAFIITISFYGCVSNCGIINNPCCENNACNSPHLVCVENKCMDFKLNISTDKELYQSRGEANITVTIDSSGNLNNAAVKIYGIEAKGKFKLNSTESLNLTSGINIKNMIFTLPACNKCAGINPGTHKIYADLLYNGTVISNSTKDIELRQ